MMFCNPRLYTLWSQTQKPSAAGCACSGSSGFSGSPDGPAVRRLLPVPAEAGDSFPGLFFLRGHRCDVDRECP